jgi:hypothetical protein
MLFSQQVKTVSTKNVENDWQNIIVMIVSYGMTTRKKIFIIVTTVEFVALGKDWELIIFIVRNVMYVWPCL